MTRRSARLDLSGFLPYRLSVVTNRLSRTLAGLYADRFDLTIPEWRVMAVLAPCAGQTADQIGAATEMDKVTVSRAVARLRGKGYLRRDVSARDRRRYHLTLTDEGYAVYGRVVPLARRVEREVLAGLSDRERRALEQALGALERRVAAVAEAYARRGQ